MIMAIIPRAEADRVVEALVESGQTATTIDSRSGVLRQMQKILFIATGESELENVLTIIRANCRHEVVIGSVANSDPYSLGSIPVTAELGGAVVFIWDIERVETF